MVRLKRLNLTKNINERRRQSQQQPTLQQQQQQGQQVIVVQDSNSTNTWKILSAFLLIFLILFATDSIELKHDMKKMKDSEPRVQSSTDQGSINASGPYHEEGYHQYTPRARNLPQEETDALVQKWGSWTLVDDKKRPKPDFFNEYPNRDVPNKKFPSNAWQKDSKYVGKFLTESKQLVMRAMEAILAEYGYGKDNSVKSFEERSKMFQLDRFNFEEADPPQNKLHIENGGWTTNDSWDGLKRHLLHSIMTADNFVLAVAGHSVTAAHGNHFQQSYPLQVQKVLEPIFARLGVKFESRNVAYGGLGTSQSGFASSSIFGPDVSMLMFDADITEKGPMFPDMMARQAIIGSGKVPVLWSFPTDVMKNLNTNAGIPVGAHGTASLGIETATTANELDNIPWAARYIKCNNDIEKDFCKPHEFNGTCWIHRSDYKPATAQDEFPFGRTGWHVGFREHQLIGRTLAFTILQALFDALDLWDKASGHVLPDDTWHVTDFFATMRSKVLDMDPSQVPCMQIKMFGLEAVCNVPFQARTMFTPRAHPSYSSIRSIMPKQMEENILPTRPNAYLPPDVFNPYLHPPPGEVDVTGIVELGVPFKPVVNPSVEHFYRSTKFTASITARGIKPGKGIKQIGKGADHLCDGTYDSFCDRNEANSCLLSSQNDARGALCMDGYSGWTVMNIPDVSYGMIVLKFHTWHSSSSVSPEHWKSINNEDVEGFVSENTGQPVTGLGPDYCGEFKFEYMIDGIVTTWDADTMENKMKKHVQRVAEMFVLLDDRDYTQGETKDVEVAFRLIGCGRQKSFGLTHVYWA